MGMIKTLVITMLSICLSPSLFAIDDLKTEDSVIKLENYQYKPIRISGDWRFANKILSNINDESFQSLEPKNLLTGNISYLSYEKNPAKGSYVLAIDSDQDYHITAMTDGFMTTGEILVQQPNGTEIAYSDPKFHDNSFIGAKNQITEFSFELNLKKGRNYLIYNYKQDPLVKSDGLWTNAGFSGSLVLSDRITIENRKNINFIFLQIPLGVFFCLAVYSLLIYFSRHREDIESLYLFLFNAAIFLKEFGSQSIYTKIFGPSSVSLDFASFGFVGALFGAAIAAKMLDRKVPSKIIKICFWIILGNGTLGFINSEVLNRISFIPYTGNIGSILILLHAVVFFFLFLPVVFIKAIKSKREDVTLFSIGIAFLALGQLIDFVKIATNGDWPWLSMVGGMFMSILLAKNNSSMFAKAFDDAQNLNEELEVKNAEVKELNRGLEAKVEKRTAEINALLQHIPQGVLSICEDGVVDKNFSAQLPELLGHRNIAGMSIKDVFLNQTDLSNDQKDQVWQTIFSSVGEYYLNFEANEKKLPVELGYTINNVKKQLKLTWNADVDENDEVARVLVTILDITAESFAKKELEEKEKDFKVIRQLLGIEASKATGFFGSANQLIAENIRLIKAEDYNIDTLKLLFVNMHTLKGAARTLGLNEMASAFHDVETYYSQVIRGEAVMKGEKLLQDILDANNVYLRYQSVNKDVLGRDDDLSTVAIGRDFLEENFKMLTSIEDQMDIPMDLREIIQRNRDKLTNYIFTSLTSVLAEAFKNAHKIAKDLDKEDPIIEIDMKLDDIHITQTQEVALKNAFVHILRNALDHGIESPDERQKLKKSRKGRILVSASLEHNEIHVEVTDDGRGFAIEKLRSKGIASGKIDKNASLEDIVELAFEQGFSTATQLSLVSGRGVGMDAIRRFVRSEQGDVEIKLLDSIDSNNEYYRFKVVIQLPYKSEIQKAS